ncbi:putative PEP-binding protein [Vibrio sp. RC27]
MSFEPIENEDNQMILGHVLPSENTVQQESSHLYISLSELIADTIFYHPSVAGLSIDQLTDSDAQALKAVIGEQRADEYFVETLVSTIKNAIASESYQTVRLCLSDADSYEYKALIGGSLEDDEVNPAMGIRGVSRLSSDSYKLAFELECEVIKILRNSGVNIEIVVPFVRALSDAATVIDRLAEKGLPRGLNGLKVLYSCDVPSSALLADKLLQYFDGIVLNVEHLTQFTLGVDKYNEELDYLYKSDNDAVTSLITTAIKSARNAKKPALVVVNAIEEHPKLKFLLTGKSKADVVFSF